MNPTYSNNEVNRSGRRLSNTVYGGAPFPPTDPDGIEELYRALHVVRWFRAEHQRPLTTANMGLRSMVRTEGLSSRPTQRLKRLHTILDKLQREPEMNLARM